ncbi:PaaI family thioesterase [Streptomyces sp. NPDC002928]|uniref:PaaI family thioesterase n=1 Tax=Streptomyces sp. NPDC002928 TaxID=3154440 RepID=UPI0033B9DB63
MSAPTTEPPATNPTPVRPTAEELDHQRTAIAALGHELRALVDATVRTATPTETLHRVTEGVRRLTGQLTGRRRSRAEIPAVDEFPGGVRMYSPVTGAGSPLAPPMQVTPDSGGVVGHCTLGIAHEGPPGFVHGGVSAMLLDELMGWACYAAGTPAMTVSLQMRYHRPVPVEIPLRVYARVTGTEDRKIFVDGSISIEDDPSVSVVTAEGVFVAPDPDRARALFPSVSS